MKYYVIIPTAASVRGQKQPGAGELVPRLSSQCSMCHGAGYAPFGGDAQPRGLNFSSHKTSQGWEKGSMVGAGGPEALKVATSRPKAGRGAAFSTTNTPPPPNFSQSPTHAKTYIKIEKQPQN